MDKATLSAVVELLTLSTSEADDEGDSPNKCNKGPTKKKREKKLEVHLLPFHHHHNLTINGAGGKEKQWVHDKRGKIFLKLISIYQISHIYLSLFLCYPTSLSYLFIKSCTPTDGICNYDSFWSKPVSELQLIWPKPDRPIIGVKLSQCQFFPICNYDYDI